MATDDMAREERLEYCGMVVDEFHQSGLTKTEYCQKNDIGILWMLSLLTEYQKSLNGWM